MILNIDVPNRVGTWGPINMTIYNNTIINDTLGTVNYTYISSHSFYFSTVPGVLVQ